MTKPAPQVTHTQTTPSPSLATEARTSGAQVAEHIQTGIPVDTYSSRESAGAAHKSPLAALVTAHLRANGLRQIDFCRQAGFDQGLLSKILSSVVNTLNVESALKLAVAMQLEPRVIFEAIGKVEVDDLLRKFYARPAGTR